MAGRLQRILGVGFGLAVTLGSTLGVGILRSPGPVAAQLHTPGLILAAWIAGGLYTLLGAICLTELGTMAPQAGGYYVYARRAFGDWVGFAVGWTDWITYCAVLGYVSIAIAEFAGTLIPAAAGRVAPIAIGVLLCLVALQWAGVRISSRFQEWTTALKCLAFLALIAAGLVLAGGGAAPAEAAPLAPASLRGGIGALQLVVITYAGWQSALYFTEEDRDAARNLPRAMIGGVVAVLAIYVLVNLALLAILPIAQLAHATLPAADAAERLIGPRGLALITLLSMISLLPSLNAIMMIGTRILFAMGRDRLLWSATAEVNAGGTPGIATLVTTAVTVAGILAFGTFQRLVAIAACFVAINYAVCCLAQVVLRRREPAVPRPFRAWGYPWSAAIVVTGALAFLGSAMVADSAITLAALGITSVGLAGYAILRARRA
ncbi:MAG TPA: APC family permease [Kofleriaceae bacterium]|nr:APC family permease [Kofleriaceae bacterium]